MQSSWPGAELPSQCAWAVTHGSRGLELLPLSTEPQKHHLWLCRLLICCWSPLFLEEKLSAWIAYSTIKARAECIPLPFLHRFIGLHFFFIWKFIFHGRCSTCKPALSVCSQRLGGLMMGFTASPIGCLACTRVMRAPQGFTLVTTGSWARLCKAIRWVKHRLWLVRVCPSGPPVSIIKFPWVPCMKLLHWFQK